VGGRRKERWEERGLRTTRRDMQREGKKERRSEQGIHTVQKAVRKIFKQRSATRAS
jgi:hypothetical protein